MLTSTQCRVVAYWTEDGLCHPDHVGEDDRQSPVIAYTASEYRSEADDRSPVELKSVPDAVDSYYAVFDDDDRDTGRIFDTEHAAWDHINDTCPPLHCARSGEEIDA